MPRFDLANCTDFEDYAHQRNSKKKITAYCRIEKSFEYPTGKIDNSYTQALTEASFKLEGTLLKGNSANMILFSEKDAVKNDDTRLYK